MPETERRIRPRRRTFKAAKIVLNKGGAAAIDCTVRNLAETGALIRIGNAVTVPEEFSLAELYAVGLGTCTAREKRRERKAGRVLCENC